MALPALLKLLWFFSLYPGAYNRKNNSCPYQTYTVFAIKLEWLLKGTTINMDTIFHKRKN